MLPFFFSLTAERIGYAGNFSTCRYYPLGRNDNLVALWCNVQNIFFHKHCVIKCLLLISRKFTDYMFKLQEIPLKTHFSQESEVYKK